MTKQEILCLLGNTSCGKTSLCQWINSQTKTNESYFLAIDRDDARSLKHGINWNAIENLLFEYPFNEENFQKPNLEDQTRNGEKIYWIILDCDVDILFKRNQSKTTKKSLFYFQQRFRYLSSHFGIPLIDTTTKTLDEIYRDVVDLVEKYSNYYRFYRQIRTQILNYGTIEQFDIENKLNQIIKIEQIDEINDLPEYANEVSSIDKRKLYVRWYLKTNSFEIDQEKSKIKIGIYEFEIEHAIFLLVNEGESKKIYKDISGNPFTKDLAFIVLKSTIYSHSMQITGEIESLGYFLDFLFFLKILRTYQK